MSGGRTLVLLSCVNAAIAASVAGSHEGGEAPWEAVSVGSCKIAVPKGWRNFDRMGRNILLYRQGDGVRVPALDETNAPLQIGLTVEKLPRSEKPFKEIMSDLVAAGKKAPRLELVGKEIVDTIKLSDGSEAMLVKMEFIKEGRRRSLQMKLVAKDADTNVWIVSGQLVGGKESKLPTADSDLAKWLEAHLTSFSLDEKKFDVEKVKAAYKDRDKE